MRSLDRLRREFHPTGNVFAVDLVTGEIREISLHLYALCQEENLLGGYDVQPNENRAKASQLRIWGQLAGRN